jgi:hypothetical protein
VKGLFNVWWLEFMTFNNNLPDVKGQKGAEKPRQGMEVKLKRRKSHGFALEAGKTRKTQVMEI